MSIEVLLKKVRSSPFDASVLREIEARAAEVVEFLRVSEEESATSWEGTSPEWLAQVYGALAAGLGCVDVDPAIDEELFAADIRDREAVGRAFAEVLVPSIPDGVRRLIDFCRENVRPPSSSVVEQLVDEPDVKAAGPVARELAIFGITPMQVVLATDAVALLLNRAIEAEHFPRRQPLYMEYSSEKSVAVRCDDSDNLLSGQELIDEIADVTGRDQKASRELLRWAIYAARYVPLIFFGFRVVAEPKQNALQLVALAPEEAPSNLQRRWKGEKVGGRFTFEPLGFDLASKLSQSGSFKR
jgi:hypothetical protein